MHFVITFVSLVKPAHFQYSRLLTLIAGFGQETFSTGDYFFWIPWIVPHIGAVIGAAVGAAVGAAIGAAVGAAAGASA